MRSMRRRQLPIRLIWHSKWPLQSLIWRSLSAGKSGCSELFNKLLLQTNLEGLQGAPHMHRCRRTAWLKKEGASNVAPLEPQRSLQAPSIRMQTQTRDPWMGLCRM